MRDFLAGLFGSYLALCSALGWAETLQPAAAIHAGEWSEAAIIAVETSSHNEAQNYYTPRIEHTYLCDGTLQITDLKDTFEYQGVC